MPVFLNRIMFLALRAPVGLSLDIQGRTDLIAEGHTPCVYIVNHQSFIDAPILGRLMPSKAAYVSKKAVVYVPVLGFLLWYTNNILIEKKKRDQSVSALIKAAGRVCSINFWAIFTLSSFDHLLLFPLLILFCYSLFDPLLLFPLLSSFTISSFEFFCYSFFEFSFAIPSFDFYPHILVTVLV